MKGFRKAGIGFSVSHDALHGAYSSNKHINRALGFAFDLLGANGYIWKITHNIIHHTYTNIHGHDEENIIDEHWMIHEMVTTNNFARDNKVLCWFVGGLNFQIEHHLFPKVCSIHYPAISHIVEQTAHEFGIPYNQHDTFIEAVASHYRTLKKFEDPEFIYSEARI